MHTRLNLRAQFTLASQNILGSPSGGMLVTSPNMAYTLLAALVATVVCKNEQQVESAMCLT